MLNELRYTDTSMTRQTLSINKKRKYYVMLSFRWSIVVVSCDDYDGSGNCAIEKCTDNDTARQNDMLSWFINESDTLTSLSIFQYPWAHCLMYKVLYVLSKYMRIQKNYRRYSCADDGLIKIEIYNMDVYES